MNKMTLPILALIVLCGTAVAADPEAAPSADAAVSAECMALEKKYDDADKTEVTADKLNKANAKRAEGAKLCTAGNADGGVKYLKSALKLIGLKPTE